MEIIHKIKQTDVKNKNHDRKSLNAFDVRFGSKLGRRHDLKISFKLFYNVSKHSERIFHVQRIR